MNRPGALARALASDRVIFGGALLVRLLVTYFYGRHHVTVTGLELGTLADNLLAGRGFVWEFYGSTVPRRAFFPPFYPLFIALLKVTCGAAWIGAMQFLQALPSAATAVVVRRLGMHLDPKSAVLAAYAVVLWPPLVIYSAAAYSVTFEAFLVTWIVLLLVRAAAGGRRAAIAAGAAYGVLGTMLPAFLGSLLLAPLGYRMMRLPWRRIAGITLVAGGCAFLVLTPWTIRNAIRLHRFVPVATNIGFNYLGGQNQFSLPHNNILCAFDDQRWQVIDRSALETMNEADFDRLLLRQGLEFAKAHPGLTVRRSAERLLYYWWGSPFIRRYNPEQGRVNMLLMSVVMPFFVVGLVMAVRARARYGLLLAVFLWQSAFYMHFAIRGRYALPTHPLMLLVAAAGAMALWSRIARRSAIW